MGNMRRQGILIALVLVAASCATAPERPSYLPPLRPASPEVESLVKTAIGERFRAGDIPDQGLLKGQGIVFVFNEMEEVGLLLGPGAVPDGKFALINRTEARDRASSPLTEIDPPLLIENDPG